jgi:hypothetical protein
MKRPRVVIGWSSVVVGLGMISGCGSQTANPNLPPPKMSTEDQQKKAAASVEAGRPNIQAPGAPGAPKAAKK